MNLECPRCEGTGVVMHAVAGGFYNPQLGGWEPDEEARECDLCDGERTVTADGLDVLTEEGELDNERHRELYGIDAVVVEGRTL